MYIDIPKNFVEVNAEQFEAMKDEVFYTRANYSNATEYRLKSIPREIFGYETTRGQYFLQRNILDDLISGARNQ